MNTNFVSFLKFVTEATHGRVLASSGDNSRGPSMYLIHLLFWAPDFKQFQLSA